MVPPKKPLALHASLLAAAAIVALVCAAVLQPSSGIREKAERSPSRRRSTSERSDLQISPDETLDHSFLTSLTDAQIADLVSAARIGAIDPDQAEDLGEAIPGRALFEDRRPEEYAASLFPETAELLAMLARDRDVDDYLENAEEKGPAGAYYQSVVNLVPALKPLRGVYERFFEGVFEGLDEMHRFKVPVQAFPDSRLYSGGVTLPGFSSKPRASDYQYSHTYALDIFLKDVDLVPFSTLQKGPMVFSLSDSIVVSADSSWTGGEDLSTYRSGGITPKAGNGVILYSPAKKRFYLYFHLHDVLVSPGDLVPRGYPLGHGGNTGTNARKKGHGEHLHLEIYDAAGERFLKNYEIADIVF